MISIGFTTYHHRGNRIKGKHSTRVWSNRLIFDYVCMYVCMISFTLTARKIESDMKGTTSIYIPIWAGRIYHLLDELEALLKLVVA